MKKIIVLSLGVLFCTPMFASGKDDASENKSSVVVLNSTGSNLFKVVYKARLLGDVKVSIVNDQQQIVFSETIKQKSGFMRPYNFDGLPKGDYSIQIDDQSGTHVERVAYGTESRNAVHVTKLNTSGKYLLTGNFKSSEQIQVRIYNSENEIVFDENREVSGEFGEVYNLKKLPGSFTMEITDGQGVLKQIQY